MIFYPDDYVEGSDYCYSLVFYNFTVLILAIIVKYYLWLYCDYCRDYSALSAWR